MMVYSILSVQLISARDIHSILVVEPLACVCALGRLDPALALESAYACTFPQGLVNTHPVL
jgi:hypothetical protein